jgi:hypothetical protein
MNQRCQLLSDHAVVITKEGPMVAHSNEDVKDIISHHFEIRKSEFYVTCRCPDSFLAYFHFTHDRNVVFVAASVVVVVLGLHAWDIDWFGNKELIPYHVKLSLKGIPSHAWFQEIAQLILGDEAIIRHVDEETEGAFDHRAFQCWVVCRDPSRIPQIVFCRLQNMMQIPGGMFRPI